MIQLKIRFLIKTFKSTHSSLNSRAFVVGSAMFALFLIGIFTMQNKSEITAVMGQMITLPWFITGLVLCTFGIGWGIYEHQLNEEQYKMRPE